MKIILAGALAVAAGSTTGTDWPLPVQVGHAKWDRLPSLTLRSGAPSTPVEAAVEVADRRLCDTKGISPSRVDVTVRYALFVTPDGRAERVLVEDVGCRPLEAAVAAAAINVDARRLVPPGGSTARWYGNAAAFDIEVRR